MDLYFVTSNENKLREASQILGIEVKSAKIALSEEQEIEVDKIIESKTKAAYRIIKRPVIVEDTGLYFEAMNGFPGALIKWVLKSTGNVGAVKMLDGYDHRKAYAKTSIGYFDGENFKVFSGIIRGKISNVPKGENGFGWDMIFIPENHDKTFAEMSDAEKNCISMRKLAFENLKNFLKA